jgi:hypothetical protein
MHDVGQKLVSSTFSEETNTSKQFHVICSVEDFEGIGSGIRGELTRFGDVSYSCVWSQFERLSSEPLIEVCPIYKAYHQPKPDDKYTLVAVCANVGSITPLVSMLTHMIYDRGFDDYEAIQIMSPVVHIDAKSEFERRIVLDRVKWAPAQFDTAFGDSWTTLPGIGGNPIARIGFSNSREYLQYMPAEVSHDLGKRRRHIREHRLTPKGRPLD